MDMIQLGADVLKELEARGWKIERSTSREPLLPAEISRRYPRIPGELIGFLEMNEFELMSLDQDDDVEWKTQVRGFWDRHFPFMLAVHSDYDYLAVSLDGRSYGEVVHGCGDDFLQPSAIAPSFAEFLTLFREFVASRRDDYPLGVFV